jgi:AAA domain
LSLIQITLHITTITILSIISFNDNNTKSFKYTEIRLFPSEIFYQGQLVDAKQISDEISKYNQTRQIRYPNNVLCGLLEPWNLHPVTFFDLSSEEERIGKSFKNESEVRYVVSMIEQLKDSLVSLSYSVAVITPYKAQVKRLKQALEPVIDSQNRLLGNNRDGTASFHGNRINGNGRNNGNQRNNGNNRQGQGQGQGQGQDGGKKGKNEEGEINEKDDTLGSLSQPFDCEVNSVDGFQVTV